MRWFLALAWRLATGNWRWPSGMSASCLRDRCSSGPLAATLYIAGAIAIAITCPPARSLAVAGDAPTKFNQALLPAKACQSQHTPPIWRLRVGQTRQFKHSARPTEAATSFGGLEAAEEASLRNQHWLPPREPVAASSEGVAQQSGAFQRRQSIGFGSFGWRCNSSLLGRIASAVV